MNFQPVSQSGWSLRLALATAAALCLNSCALLDHFKGERRRENPSGQADVVSLGDYRFASGSRVNLAMFQGGENLMERGLVVDPSGNLLVEGIGPVSVDGLTPLAAAKKIEFLARSGGQNHLGGPRVHIDALDQRAVVHVSGNVNLPGPVTFHPGMTVEEAIRVAGGATVEANRGAVGLTSEGRKKIVTSPQTSRLKEGDVVNVPRRL